MLSWPFLSSYVPLLPKHHHHFTHCLLRCVQSTERVFHLSVVYGWNQEETSLVFASEKGYLKTVKFLVSRGADMHAGNDEALIWASKYGYSEIIKFLIFEGADVHTMNDRALRYAQMNSHLEAVKNLVEKGAGISRNNK